MEFVSRAAELFFYFFYFYFYLFFTHFVWNYLVVKMRFEHPTCCICHETFCIQISCSNNSAISPTKSLPTSNYTTPIIDHFFNSAIYYVVYVVCPEVLITEFFWTYVINSTV